VCSSWLCSLFSGELCCLIPGCGRWCSMQSPRAGGLWWILYRPRRRACSARRAAQAGPYPAPDSTLLIHSNSQDAHRILNAPPPPLLLFVAACCAGGGSLCVGLRAVCLFSNGGMRSQAHACPLGRAKSSTPQKMRMRSWRKKLRRLADDYCCFDFFSSPHGGGEVQ